MSTQRPSADAPMPKWKAWLFILPMLFLTGLLVFFGLVIFVRCERVQEGRVNISIERRFLGLLTVSSEIIPDVTHAGVKYGFARTSSGGKKGRGATIALELTPRDAEPVVRTRFGPSIGTEPIPMAKLIEQFIKESSDPALTSWWMPWLVNLCAVPFVLIFGWLLIEVSLRRLGCFKSPAA